MRRLPLHPERESSPLEASHRADLRPGCTSCELSKWAQGTRCIPADGSPKRGGLLIVGEGPGRDEDRAGRPFVGISGRKLRQTVQKHWNGPVVYDNATRCASGQLAINNAHVDTCRPYLAQTFYEAAPERIVALGITAFQSILGRRPPVLSVRRGYGWVRHPEREEPIPVWLVSHPAAAARNRHVDRAWRRDMEHALTQRPPFEPVDDAHFNLVESVDDSWAAVEDLRAEAEWFAYDTETAGLTHTDYFEILTLAAVSSGTDEPYVWEREALADPEVREPLELLLEDSFIGKVGHNLKFDQLAPRNAWGTAVQGTHGDTRLWRKLLEAHVESRLETAAELVGMGGHKEENDRYLRAAVKRIKDARKRSAQQVAIPGLEDPALEAAVRHNDADPMAFAYGLVPPAVRARYCARDALATVRLGDLQEPKIQDNKATHHIWTRVVKDATPAIEMLEYWGVGISRAAVESFSEYVGYERERVRKRLEAYGRDFNPGSNQQVGDLLFNRLGLSVISRTPTGAPQVDGATLEKLQHKHPVVRDLQEYRRLGTMETRYGRPMLRFIRDDGRIHTEFKLDGTETGRLSCQDPPLHQIPRAEDAKGNAEGRLIRDCFAAAPGYYLLQLDYGQLEYRVAAILSGDPVMKAMFERGEDFHKGTAKLIAPQYWGIRPEDVGKPQRSTAKNFNFGLLYGMSDKGMAARLGCSVEDAARLRQAIMGQWTVLARWLQATLDYARKHGVVWTWWDGKPARCRQLWDIASNDNGRRTNAENAAVNTPVQGTASDFCLASINVLVPWLIRTGFPARLVLTVHDSLIFEVREDAVEDLARKAREVMLSWYAAGVPLQVDAEYGRSWGSLEELALPEAA